MLSWMVRTSGRGALMLPACLQKGLKHCATHWAASVTWSFLITYQVGNTAEKNMLKEPCRCAGSLAASGELKLSHQVTQQLVTSAPCSGSDSSLSSHSMRITDMASACGTLAPPDAGWPLPGEPGGGMQHSWGCSSCRAKIQSEMIFCNPKERWTRKAGDLDELREAPRYWGWRWKKGWAQAHSRGTSTETQPAAGRTAGMQVPLWGSQPKGSWTYQMPLLDLTFPYGLGFLLICASQIAPVGAGRSMQCWGLRPSRCWVGRACLACTSRTVTPPLSPSAKFLARQRLLLLPAFNKTAQWLEHLHRRWYGLKALFSLRVSRCSAWESALQPSSIPQLQGSQGSASGPGQAPWLSQPSPVLAWGSRSRLLSCTLVVILLLSGAPHLFTLPIPSAW